jgi:hypothetical protein
MNYYTIVLYKSSIRVDRKYKSQDQDLKWHPMRRKFFSSSETTNLIEPKLYKNNNWMVVQKIFIFPDI